MKLTDDDYLIINEEYGKKLYEEVGKTILECLGYKPQKDETMDLDDEILAYTLMDEDEEDELE